MIEYPIRCEILDVVGIEVLPGIIGDTPEVSKPHIGKHGVAIEEGENVKIILDDGNILYGYECWWKPIEERRV